MLETTQNYQKMFLAILDKGISKSYLEMSRRDVCENDYSLVTKRRK